MQYGILQLGGNCYTKMSEPQPKLTKPDSKQRTFSPIRNPNHQHTEARTVDGRLFGTPDAYVLCYTDMRPETIRSNNKIPYRVLQKS